LDEKQFERLTTDIVPSHYSIRLQPSLQDFMFDGSQEIEIEIVKPTNSISLHCADVSIVQASIKCLSVPASSSKSVFHSGQLGCPVADIEYNEKEEIATLCWETILPMGKAILSLVFHGEINEKLKGFYRSKYDGPDGEQRFMACTQFCPTDARRAFPCWDEPALKASFEVTLVIPKNRTALSNMPVKSETELSTDQAWKVVSFEKTPIMSTYLLAFIVGEFDFVEGKSADGIVTRVYTPLGKKLQGEFALDVAVKTLPFYREYFNIGYPLPKIDLVAIPDFAFGAMENWGLVTYRETRLLIDPANSSASSKQVVALVVGHELAHQWFGNLVTMEWWTHLWLNEGFASWIEYLCVDFCIPDFKGG